MHQFYTPDIAGNTYTLSEDESKHCIRVLRMTVGDTIRLLDGKGAILTAKITNDHPKKCLVTVIDTQTYPKKLPIITIGIAPTKNMERLEWFIEKATEIGINSIIPIVCKNSERVILKNERLLKVAVSAIKQCLNPYLPEIKELTDFKKAIELSNSNESEKFIAHCYSDSLSHLKNIYTKNKNAFILIGPEGDFTKEEVEFAVENGYKEISLGKNRLRTETAGLYACSIINIINE